MICQSIIFAIAFSFLIVDIKPTVNDLENINEQLHALSLFGNDESDNESEESILEEENEPVEENIPHKFRQTTDEMKYILAMVSSSEEPNYMPSEEEVTIFFNNEEELLKQVENFLNDINPYEYRPPDNEIAYGLVHVAYLTYWISANFRICTLLYSENSIFGHPRFARNCRNRFYQSVKEFNNFKEKIEYFFTIEKDYGRPYGNDIQVECVAKEVLTLSSDFVLDEDVLQTKQDPDEYVDGMIKWSFIDDTMIDGKAYKTILPSFKKLFCNCRNVDRLCFNYGLVSIDYDDENGHNYPWNLYDTDRNLIPQYSYQNSFEYYYPVFNVCNCGTLEECCSSSSRNDDTGVYNDTNIASSSSNRADGIYSCNEEIRKKNRRTLRKISQKIPDLFTDDPTIIDMYKFLRILIDTKVDHERFNLIHNFSTIKIGKGNKLEVTKFTTWLYGHITNDVMPMWWRFAEIENEIEENIFSLIRFIRKLDKKASLRELFYQNEIYKKLMLSN